MSAVRQEKCPFCGTLANSWSVQKLHNYFGFDCEVCKSLLSHLLIASLQQTEFFEVKLERFDPKACDPEVYREQSLFVENQIRWCLQGWAKATPAVRKRLLRRTIKEIFVTQTELCITFWKGAEERDNSVLGSNSTESEGSENVLAFRRRSPPGQDQNLWIKSAGNIGIGRPEANVLKPTQLSVKRIYRVQWKKTIANPEELAKLYWVQGLSQVEIARRCKTRRATISAAVSKYKPVG